MNQIMFHTQENRRITLSNPVLCTRKDAWLGTAYYFWEDESDAIKWGQNSKGDCFQTYSALIKSDKVLDTVFNREQYDFL